MNRSLRPAAIAMGVAAALAFPAGALAAGHNPPNLTCDSSDSNGSSTADSPATWVIAGTQLDGSMQEMTATRL